MPCDNHWLGLLEECLDFLQTFLAAPYKEKSPISLVHLCIVEKLKHIVLTPGAPFLVSAITLIIPYANSLVPRVGFLPLE